MMIYGLSFRPIGLNETAFKDGDWTGMVDVGRSWVSLFSVVLCGGHQIDSFGYRSATALQDCINVSTI
jgi:hypothetical protein